MNIWKFNDPKDTAVIADKFFAEKKEPCLYVTHDQEDGGWQFLTQDTNGRVERAIVLALSTVVSLDESLNDIADLPPGWFATRKSQISRWERSPK